MLRTLLLTLPLLWPLATQAQTKASCTFNFISTATPFTYNGIPQFIVPRGINDFGTIVGSETPGPPLGLIRWANGGVTKVKGTTYLVARNDHGTSVGLSSLSSPYQGILVNGTTITPIVLGVNNQGVEVKGINKWGTISGVFYDDIGFGIHGFKRWNNGATHTLDFPGASYTQPWGINDNGTVVGSYSNADLSTHGFIFQNGQWATLDYPLASITELVGITNAGKIIGLAASKSLPWTPFLYENGTFKVISVPNSVPGSQPFIWSISPKLGLILGTTGGYDQPAFIAQCQ